MSIENFQKLIDALLQGNPNAIEKLIGYLEARIIDEPQTKHFIDTISSINECDTRWPNALYLRGIIEEYGMRGSVNHPLAIEYIDKAILYNHSGAMVSRALIHKQEAHYEEALRLLDIAIALDDPNAMNARACALLDHLKPLEYKSEVKCPEVIRLFDHAIELNCYNAMINRSIMHKVGLGGDVNHSESSRLYQQAIALNPLCEELPISAMSTQIVNYAELFRQLDEAIKSGDSKARFIRVNPRHHGNGCTIDQKKAMLLYRSIASLGHVKTKEILPIYEHTHMNAQSSRTQPKAVKIAQESEIERLLKALQQDPQTNQVPNISAVIHNTSPEAWFLMQQPAVSTRKGSKPLLRNLLGDLLITVHLLLSSSSTISQRNGRAFIDAMTEIEATRVRPRKDKATEIETLWLPGLGEENEVCNIALLIGLFTSHSDHPQLSQWLIKVIPHLPATTWTLKSVQHALHAVTPELRNLIPGLPQEKRKPMTVVAKPQPGAVMKSKELFAMLGHALYSDVNVPGMNLDAFEQVSAFIRKLPTKHYSEIVSDKTWGADWTLFMLLVDFYRYHYDDLAPEQQTAFYQTLQHMIIHADKKAWLTGRSNARRQVEDMPLDLLLHQAMNGAGDPKKWSLARAAIGSMNELKIVSAVKKQLAQNTVEALTNGMEHLNEVAEASRVEFQEIYRVLFPPTKRFSLTLFRTPVFNTWDDESLSIQVSKAV